MQRLRRASRLLHQAAPHAAGAWLERCGAAAASGCMHSNQNAWQSGQSRSTTVLCVRKGEEVVIMADGQVTKGNEIVKPNVRKVRKIGDGKAIAGFAGATADAFTLFERLEMQLEAHPGQLTRAAVELAKLWRTDKYLRRLDAVMVVADKKQSLTITDHKKQSLTITGNGDVLEPHDGVIAIGSGGGYALAAARALIDLPDLKALDIADKAMTIAADVCIYTNHNFTVEALKSEVAPEQPSKLLAGH